MNESSVAHEVGMLVRINYPGEENDIWRITGFWSGASGVTGAHIVRVYDKDFYRVNGPEDKVWLNRLTPVMAEVLRDIRDEMRYTADRMDKIINEDPGVVRAGGVR